MNSARIRFETIGVMDGEAIRSQIAQVVKGYSARMHEDDASHRAMAAMRLQDGVRRLLEGGHRAPPSPAQQLVSKQAEKKPDVKPAWKKAESKSALHHDDENQSLLSKRQSKVDDRPSLSFYEQDEDRHLFMDDDMEDYGMSNHLVTVPDAAGSDAVRDGRAFSKVAEAKANMLLDELFETKNDDFVLTDSLMDGDLPTEQELQEELRQELEKEDYPVEDLDLVDEAPAPPPKPKHIRMQMQMLRSQIEEEPELLESLPEIGE